MSDRRFDVLFIDFYGTLVTGDRAAVERTCARVVTDHDLPMTAPELAIAWGNRFFDAIGSANHEAFETLFALECRTLCETIAPYVARIDPTPYAQMLKDYWQDPPVAPGACEALDAVKLPVCVVSNADTEDVVSAVSRRNLRVDRIVTSEDARSYKPDAAIFELALREMNVSPDRVLHAGDSLHSDVGGAAPLGMATCWVHYEDRILDVGNGKADYRVSHLGELCSIL